LMQIIDAVRQASGTGGRIVIKDHAATEGKA
jgi:hypothetical protein